MDYVFDVDDALVEPHKCINLSFHDQFLHFCEQHSVMILTTNKSEEVEEILGKQICRNVKIIQEIPHVNVVYFGNHDIQTLNTFRVKDWKQTKELLDGIESTYYTRFGYKHIA